MKTATPSAPAAGSGQRARRAAVTPIEKAAAGVDDRAYVPCPVPRSHSGSTVALTPTPWWSDEFRANRTKFPPPADTTPMVQCDSGERRCRRVYPFYYGVGCMCEDCRQARWQAYVNHLRDEGLLAEDDDDRTPPPAVQGKRLARISCELEDAGARIQEPPLPTEDEAALKRQIDRYLAGQRTSLIRVDLSAGGCA